jgi:hypothetical protein
MTTLCGTPFTIDWVEEKLKEYSKNKNAKLINSSFEQIGIGRGYLSTILCMKLQWNVENLPSTVVLKVNTPKCCTLKSIFSYQTWSRWEKS